MLDVIQRLCQGATGSQCSPPRLSSWHLVEPSQANVGVDVADLASGGAGALVPANLKLYGSYFSTGLERRADAGGLSAQLSGFGVGGGAAVGWGIPFVGADGMGRVPDGVKRKVLQAVGGAVQGKAVDMLKSAAWGGISGGTQMLTGPNARNADLSIADFRGAFGTVVSFGANFVVNGVSFGMLIVSTSRPVIVSQDLVYATAFGLIGGVGLATSLDIEGTGLVYRLSVQ